MQSWVYLTLPEVKHAQEPENQSVTKKSAFTTAGKKKSALSSSVTQPLMPPQNSLENQKHPTHSRREKCS